MALSLTELTNGIVKLYSVRPRPLWVSTKLQRKGSIWEKVWAVEPLIRNGLLTPIQDSSFPSSHAQSVATLFSFIFLEGKKYLPYTGWIYACILTGTFTVLTGFSRAYLAMDFVSDVRHFPRPPIRPFVLSPLANTHSLITCLHTSGAPHFRISMIRSRVRSRRQYNIMHRPGSNRSSSAGVSVSWWR